MNDHQDLTILVTETLQKDSNLNRQKLIISEVVLIINHSRSTPPINIPDYGI